MPTSIHIPGPLLEAVDRRARRLKLSRNRFIVRVLEAELAHETQWSPGFFERIRQTSPEDSAAMDEVMGAIRKARKSKKPPRL